MDYEKKYNEALKRANQLYSEDCSAENKDTCEFIFPELAESKDVRVMEDLIGGLMWQRDNLNAIGPHDNSLILPGFCLTVGEHLAYLEKQKDVSKAIEAVERIDKYIDEHLANAHDMKDSNPDKKYYRGWDDALGKMAGILQDVYSGEKQKEHQNNSDAPKEKSVGGNFYSSHKDKNLDEIAQDYVDNVKEYTPEPTWDLMQTAVCYGYHLAEQKEQKPAWSEEDERNIRNLESILYYDKKLPEETRVELANFLNSLCPRWKPSKEQMKELELIINGKAVIRTNFIRTLYNDLKKLM